MRHIDGPNETLISVAPSMVSVRTHLVVQGKDGAIGLSALDPETLDQVIEALCEAREYWQTHGHPLRSELEVEVVPF